MMMVISRQAGDVRRDDSIATATRRWPPGDCSHRDLGTVTALPALVALLVKFARQRDEQGRHPRLRFQQVGWVSRAIPVRHGVPWPSRRCRTCWCVYTCVCVRVCMCAETTCFRREHEGGQGSGHERRDIDDICWFCACTRKKYERLRLGRFWVLQW